MTAARLIEILKEAPPDMEVVIVHLEWPINKVTIDSNQVKIQ